ncbi:MFS transporter [Haloarcula nitratireducens]|uniref:MFS transporter n=1 Tax=Haloarcula nitratireducens TaxID=2487749 RepID=A0AAW4PFK7_9EURY|nr:MFS transporter [Halomicroarcula nitratireducens]MBX0296775.1 MFS transporter [Halomicroarcula nitratireducens]
MDQNDRALTAFTMLGHAMFHTFELVIPLFIVVWLDAFSTTTTVLGLIIGASYACTGVGALPSGLLSDRVNAKWLIIGCMAGMGGGFLLVSVAPTLIVLSFGLLLWGSAASVYHPAGLSLLSRGANERGAAFAYHGMAGNVGVATGPILGALLLAFFHWRTVAALLVVPVALAILLALQLEFDETAAVTEEAPMADGRGEKATLKQFVATSKLLFAGSFLLVFFIGNLYGLYYRGVFTFLPEVLAGFSLFDPIHVGTRSLAPSQYVYSGLLLFGGVGQYAGGKLVDRYTAEHVLVANFVVLAFIAFAFIPAANAGLWPFLCISGLLGFFVFFEGPVNQEVISQAVPPDVRGLSFGWTYTAVFGVGAIGSAIAGTILEWWSAKALFAVLGVFAVLAGLIGINLSKSREH